MNPVISVENISKKYSRNSNKHLNYGVRDILKEVVGKQDPATLRKDEFWAVDDISFYLKQGDSLGLIGQNGCGKTTLLKMLNGLIKPDCGKILIDGRVQALINLGAGFNPNLSGIENIKNAASIMGFSLKQARAMIDEIVEFSGLEEFIDSPIGSYSSGMYARLGFSVAINMKPEILLIDEILSVGDYSFQNKCFTKMHQMKKEGVSIVLVSHSHTQVTQICDFAIWLDRGKAVAYGKSEDVVKKYLDHMDQKQVDKIKELKKLKAENKELSVSKLVSSTLYGPIYPDFDKIGELQVNFFVGGAEVDAVKVNDELVIRYRFGLKKEVQDLNVSLNIVRKDGMVMSTISTLNGNLLYDVHDGNVACEVVIKDFNLIPGEYVLVMPVHEGHSYLYRDIVKEFVVTKNEKMFWGVVGFDYKYSIGV